jgi:hypothetical protein
VSAEAGKYLVIRKGAVTACAWADFYNEAEEKAKSLAISEPGKQFLVYSPLCFFRGSSACGAYGRNYTYLSLRHLPK